jgi:hypothetical protein
MIKPYKNRTLNPNTPIKVYRCLNRKGHVFSIQQKGYVVGHTTDISISNAVFKINTSGKNKAIREGVRNVHAFIVGYVSNEEIVCDNDTKISYNPFLEKGFYYIATHKPIEDTCCTVKISEKGVFCLKTDITC